MLHFGYRATKPRHLAVTVCQTNTTEPLQITGDRSAPGILVIVVLLPVIVTVTANRQPPTTSTARQTHVTFRHRNSRRRTAQIVQDSRNSHHHGQSMIVTTKRRSEIEGLLPRNDSARTVRVIYILQSNRGKCFVEPPQEADRRRYRFGDNNKLSANTVSFPTWHTENARGSYNVKTSPTDKIC